MLCMSPQPDNAIDAISATYDIETHACIICNAKIYLLYNNYAFCKHSGKLKYEPFILVLKTTQPIQIICLASVHIYKGANN